MSRSIHPPNPCLSPALARAEAHVTSSLGLRGPLLAAGVVLVPALLLALLGGETDARANPMDAFGLSSRAISMGGAYTALANDVSANYYNPAGIVARGDLSLDIGYQIAVPVLKLNGRNVGVDHTRGLTAGIVAPGKVGPVRFSFGVAMFLPDERISRVRAMPRVQPRFVYYDNRTQRIYLSTNLAVQVVPGLYVGAGVTFMSRTEGDLELSGRISFPDPEAESDMRLDLDVDLKALRYPQAGILWEPLRWLSLGLVFRDEFVLEMVQGFRITGDVVGEGGGGTILRDGFFGLTSLSTNLYQPRQVAFGIAVTPIPRLIFSMDVVWAQWSRFINPGSRLEIDLDLGSFNDLVDMESQPPPPHPRFRDTWTSRLGVEWLAYRSTRAVIAVRGGYAFEPSPAPEQTQSSMNLIDNSKHHISVGLGFSLSRLIPQMDRPMDIDLHFAYVHQQRRIHRKEDPADPVGDYVATGYVISAGLTMKLRFR